MLKTPPSYWPWLYRSSPKISQGAMHLRLRRLLGGGVELHRREVADAGETYIAVAPGLLGQPLDHVVAVLALVAREHAFVDALGMADAAQVGDHVHVAALRVVAGVAAFDRSLEDRLAERLRRRVEHLGVFAVRRLSQQDRELARNIGAIDVHREFDAVARRDEHVPIDGHPTKRLRALCRFSHDSSSSHVVVAIVSRQAWKTARY